MERPEFRPSARYVVPAERWPQPVRSFPCNQRRPISELGQPEALQLVVDAALAQRVTVVGGTGLRRQNSTMPAILAVGRSCRPARSRPPWVRAPPRWRRPKALVIVVRDVQHVAASLAMHGVGLVAL
jgi:hypothetical protein